MWYFPMIPRLKWFFVIKENAKNFTWHLYGRKCNNLLWQPTNSLKWKKIDEAFSKFGVESRNLRLRIATNDMNPSRNLSCKRSSWLVLSIIYSLPPSWCMKKIYDVVYDDSRTYTTRKWYWCVPEVLEWWFETLVGDSHRCVWFILLKKFVFV